MLKTTTISFDEKIKKLAEKKLNLKICHLVLLLEFWLKIMLYEI